MNKILILAIITTLAGCAGIPFCNDKGQPLGCRKWDPATTNGGASRS